MTQVVKNLPASGGDAGSIPRSGRSPRRGNGNPLQYSCLENPMGRGAWQATVQGVPKSQTKLRDSTTTTTKKKDINSFLLKDKFFFIIGI